MAESKRSSRWTLIVSFPVALMVLGTAWSGMDVFVLRNFDKFGPFDTFRHGILILAYLSLAAFVGNLILVWVFRNVVCHWSLARITASSSAAAVLTLFLLRAGDAIRRIADPITRVLPGNEGAVYLIVMAVLPSMVMTGAIIVVRYFTRAYRHVDA